MLILTLHRARFLKFYGILNNLELARFRKQELYSKRDEATICRIFVLNRQTENTNGISDQWCGQFVFTGIKDTEKQQRIT